MTAERFVQLPHALTFIAMIDISSIDDLRTFADSLDPSKMGHIQLPAASTLEMARCLMEEHDSDGEMHEGACRFDRGGLLELRYTELGHFSFVEQLGYFRFGDRVWNECDEVVIDGGRTTMAHREAGYAKPLIVSMLNDIYLYRFVDRTWFLLTQFGGDRVGHSAPFIWNQKKRDSLLSTRNSRYRLSPIAQHGRNVEIGPVSLMADGKIRAACELYFQQDEIDVSTASFFVCRTKGEANTHIAVYHSFPKNDSNRELKRLPSAFMDGYVVAFDDVWRQARLPSPPGESFKKFISSVSRLIGKAIHLQP